jgi:ribosomal protein S18 acetylase RimI-like enzyme
MISIVETRDHELVASLAEGVQDLHYRLHPEIFKPFDKEGIVAAVKGFFADETCRAYVAYDGNTAAGYVIAYIREAKENAFHYTIRSVYVDQIAVLQQHQRTGAGRMLLEAVERLAREHSITKLELDHWTSNAVAASYFRKNGYSLRKERLHKVLS